MKPNADHSIALRRPQTSRPVWTAASLLLAAAGLVAIAPKAHAAPAHQHGVAQLDAAIDGGALTLAFSLPLDSLLGFERAPRTAAEKTAATQLAERLRKAADMVQPDPAAQCESTDVTLESAALGLGAAPATAASAAGGEEHADVDATFTFRCKAPAQLGYVDLPIVKAYPKIGRVEAQIVAAKGQAKQTIKRPAMRLTWPKS